MSNYTVTYHQASGDAVLEVGDVTKEGATLFRGNEVVVTGAQEGESEGQYSAAPGLSASIKLSVKAAQDKFDEDNGKRTVSKPFQADAKRQSDEAAKAADEAAAKAKK